MLLKHWGACCCCCCCLVTPNSLTLWAYWLQPTRLLCSWNSLCRSILEWVAMLSSRGSSQLRSNQCFLHCRQILYHWAIREASLRCICLFKLFFLFSLDIHPKVDLLTHMIMLFSVFWKNSILFFIKPITIYISTKVVFSPHPQRYLLFVVFWWFFFWQI